MRPRRFGFLLVHDFTIVPFMIAVEVLRVANRVAGKTLYEWPVYTADGKPVAASNGMAQIPDGALGTAKDLDVLFVCAGLNPERIDDRQLFAGLRRLARHGTKLGSVCTGSFILAQAGLLDGYACTIHWDTEDVFREVFPHIELSNELFIVDRDRYTCTGGTAPLDMMLHVLGQEQGAEIAIGVSELFIHDRIRDPKDHQRMTLRARLGVSHPGLLKAISLMEACLEEPLALAELARRVGLSKRQLERLFRQYLDCTPAKYYMILRLKRASLLLEQTSMSVTSVGVACGFISTSHFSRSYREQFGVSPAKRRAAVRQSLRGLAPRTAVV